MPRLWVPSLVRACTRSIQGMHKTSAITNWCLCLSLSLSPFKTKTIHISLSKLLYGTTMISLISSYQSFFYTTCFTFPLSSCITTHLVPSSLLPNKRSPKYGKKYLNNSMGLLVLFAIYESIWVVFLIFYFIIIVRPGLWYFICLLGKKKGPSNLASKTFS